MAQITCCVACGRWHTKAHTSDPCTCPVEKVQLISCDTGPVPLSALTNAGVSVSEDGDLSIWYSWVES